MEKIKISQDTQNKTKENSLAYKAKSYWKNCGNWSFKNTCPDRYNNQIKVAKELYLPLLPKDYVVLDLGCGDGWFSFEVAPLVLPYRCHRSIRKSY